MKSTFLVLKLLILFIVAVFLTVFDFNAGVIWHNIIPFLPLFLIILIFITFNDKLRWWYILIVISAYSIISYNNFIISFLLVLFVYFFDTIINSVFQRRTFSFFIVYSLIIEFTFYVTDKLSYFLLEKAGWQFLGGFFWGDFKTFIYKTLISIFVIIILYPLISLIDSRKILYTKD